MKPLPDLPDRDEPGDQTATNAVWFLVFITLGLGLVINATAATPWWVLPAGVVSLFASAWFLFLLLVRRD